MHIPRAGAANVAVEAGGAVAPKDGTLAVVAELAKPTPVKLEAVEGRGVAKLKPVAPAWLPKLDNELKVLLPKRKKDAFNISSLSSKS